MKMNQMDTVGNTLIAWEGDPSATCYVVPDNKVQVFMDKFNYHGSWRVIGKPIVMDMESLV